MHNGSTVVRTQQPLPRASSPWLLGPSFAPGFASCFRVNCVLPFLNARVICVYLLLSTEDMSSSRYRTDQKGDGSDPSYKTPPFCKDTQPFGEAWPGADKLFLGEG